MSTKALIGLSLAALFLSSSAIAARPGSRATRSEARAAEPAKPAIDTGLAGMIGLSAETIQVPGAGAAGISVPNALGVRYWTSDTFGIEGAFMLQNTSGGGTGQSNFGLMGGGVYNWKKPSEHILIQLSGRLSFLSGSTSTSVPAGPSVSTSTTTFSIYGGIGFEAFVPVWPEISLTGGMGLQFASTGSGGASTTSFNTTTSGSTPIQVGIHYYF